MPDADARKGAEVVCTRCRLEFGLGPGQCGSFTGAHMSQTALEALDARVACRDRELAQVREMLRQLSAVLEEVP